MIGPHDDQGDRILGEVSLLIAEAAAAGNLVEVAIFLFFGLQRSTLPRDMARDEWRGLD